MSFSQKLAGKYILSQKRHSVFTALSITAAVMFITVIFVLFASYWDTMKNALKEKRPHHAVIYNISEDEAEMLRENEYVAELEYVTWKSSSGSIQSDTNVLFTRDIHDPETLVRDFFEDKQVSFLLNQELLNYELIGVHAKANFVTVFSFLYVFIFIFIICARFIIDTAFEISSKEREVQFGILASLGASRKQIVRIILWEGIILSLVAIPVGILLGIGISRVIFDSVISTDILLSFLGVESSVAVFSSPLVYMMAAAVTAFAWVMLSAYGTGMRFAKKTPVEVIRRGGEKTVKVKKSRILGKLGGIVGTLASRNARRNKKRFVITVISITMSFALTVIATTLIIYTNDYVDYFRYSDVLANPYCHFQIEYYPNDNVNKVSFERKYTVEDIKKGYEIMREAGCIAQAETDIWVSVSNDEFAYNEDFFKYTSYDFANLRIEYFNEEYYNYVFGGEPPIPYNELRGGNYVVCNNSVYSEVMMGECPVDYKTDGCFSGTFSRIIPEEELKVGDNAVLLEHSPFNDKRNAYEIISEIQGNIVANGMPKSGFFSYENTINLIGCEDDLFDMLSDDSRSMFYGTYYIVLNKTQQQDLQKADIDLRDYIDNNDDVIISYSRIDMLINTERFNSALSILSTAIILIITVIALINEVNIISTGILNRRREIASLRALGMTNGQLTGMMLIECGLYSVISALATLLICEPLVLYINLSFLAEQEAGMPLLSYMSPVISVLLILLPVFLAGIITTFASLSGFNKNSISEEMKMVE